MYKVLVAMSTFNGEQFIEEQINSIFKQEKVDITLLIRDDGSTDKTINIIKKLSSQYKIQLFVGDNLGYTNSFLKLIQMSKKYYFDYFAFSDQDDVWLPQKMISGISRMGTNKRGNLVFTSLTFVDDKLNEFGTRQFDRYNISLKSAMTLSSVAGCTMIMDSELINEIVQYDVTLPEGIGHDGWVYRIALILGASVFYEDQSYILFRRHSGNASYGGKKLLGKINNFISLFFIRKKMQSEFAKLVLRLHINMSEENKKIIEKAANYDMSFKQKMNLLLDNSFDTGSQLNNALVKITILFNAY